MLLCWSTICNVDPWLGFLYTVPPHPLISMLWRALFIHLRNLFREKADAAQSIKEQNNIEIGGRGEHEERLHRDKHCTTQKKSKLLFRFTCEINSVTSSILDGCSRANMQMRLHADVLIKTSARELRSPFWRTCNLSKLSFFLGFFLLMFYSAREFVNLLLHVGVPHS